jgi:ABC-type nitrate/sulfonate/bicarbonate transport system permease component
VSATLAKRLTRIVPPVLFFAALIGVWELYVRARGTDYILPAPSQVWREFWRMAPDLGNDVRATLTAALIGMLVAVVAGVLLAVAIALSPHVRRTVYPVLVVTQTVPPIVLAPLLAVWLGFGLAPKVVIVALIGFFPIVVSTVQGLLGADTERLELIRSFGGSRLQVLWLVQAPSAITSFFAGLKIAASYAVIGAVIGEWMGASEGLGLVMTRAQRSFRTDRVFVAIVVVALVSLALFALVSVLGRLATPWATAARAHEDER